MGPIGLPNARAHNERHAKFFPPKPPAPPKCKPQPRPIEPVKMQWSAPKVIEYELVELGVISAARPFRSWLPVHSIVEFVARQHGIDVHEIIGPRRHQKLIEARHIAAHLAVRLTAKSLPEIGRAMGNRDHTTIIHANRNIAVRRQHDPNLDRVLTGWENSLRCDLQGGAHG